MKERVLITGASGFVGYHLIEAALRKGLEVHAAVRKTSQTAHLRELPIQLSYVDFSSNESIRKELEEKQYSYIIHAAGVVKAKDADAYNSSNADVTNRLAVAALESGIPLRKFVFISSLAAIGPSDSGLAITELDPARPLTHYGKSKWLAEQYLSRLNELPSIVLRPTAVYGPRDRDIFIVLKSIARGIEPYIGRIDQQLSFVYVKDLASITIDALRSQVVQRTYNVSDGHRYDRYELANLAKSILQQKTFKLHIPKGLVHVMAALQEFSGGLTGKASILNRDKLAELTAANWACNIDNIRQDLGYAPQYDLKNGLTETLHWYKDNKWLN